MRCYCKILHISYKDHVTNKEVHAKVQQAIGPHEDLLTIVKRRKLQWYGHVARSSGLAKTILQGTVKGGRRQGRQRKRWEDIREWTGLEFGRSQRAVENREKWRKLVAKSSVLTQRPSWLTGRWWWLIKIIFKKRTKKTERGLFLSFSMTEHCSLLTNFLYLRRSCILMLSPTPYPIKVDTRFEVVPSHLQRTSHGKKDF